MKKTIIFSGLVLILILVGCTQLLKDSDKVSPSTEQGVFGVVRGTPYRGMPPAPPGGWPEEGPTLNNITVQIREYPGKEERAGKIITSTKTDEKGFYQLDLPEGTYFLVIVDADVRYAITTTGYKGKNFLKEDMINTYQIINISQGELIEQNIVVPQMWPV